MPHVFLLAQSTQSVQTYLFKGGAKIDYPADWTLEIGMSEQIIFLESGETLITLLEPATLDSTVPGEIVATQFDLIYGGTPLIYDPGNLAHAVIHERQAMRYEFLNETGNSVVMFAIKFYDGSYGFAEIISFSAAMEDELSEMEDILQILATFDVNLLPNIYQFDSGVSFRYAEGWKLDDQSVDGAVFLETEDMLISLLEPEFVASYAGQTLDEALKDLFANIYGDLQFIDTNLSSIQISAREALRYVFLDGFEQEVLMIAIRFNDGRIGFVEAVKIDSQSPLQEDVVREIAASFNIQLSD